jgi:hypothetical protein
VSTTESKELDGEVGDEAGHATASESANDNFLESGSPTESQNIVAKGLVQVEVSTEPYPTLLFATNHSEGKKVQCEVGSQTQDDEELSAIGFSPFWKDYMETLKKISTKPEFNMHECWARHLAEKLKAIPAKRAELLKMEIDQIVFPLLPDDI